MYGNQLTKESQRMTTFRGAILKHQAILITIFDPAPTFSLLSNPLCLTLEQNHHLPYHLGANHDIAQFLLRLCAV